MRLIDADHLEKWIQSRWLGNGGKPTDAPTIYEIVDQIDREDTISYERDKDTNVPSNDCISRQAAIDALDGEITVTGRANAEAVRGYANLVCDRIKRLPSAQPEIIHCGDCKYQDENWRRVSVRWLPCMDVRTGSNWYCGSAERCEQDE